MLNLSIWEVYNNLVHDGNLCDILIFKPLQTIGIDPHSLLYSTPTKIKEWLMMKSSNWYPAFISSLLSWLMPISVKVQKNKINKIKSKNNHGKFRNILFVNGFPFALLTAGTRTGAKKRNDKISSIILVWTGKKYSVNITSHYFNNKTFLWSLIYKKIYHIILYQHKST